MITNTTAKSTYVVASGVTEYAIGFTYKTNPDGTPQIKVYKNKLSNTPLVYGVDYTISENGLNIVVDTAVVPGDRLDIIRNIPLVQISDYVIGRIDPEQIEGDFDLAVMRDQQIEGDIQFVGEVPQDHENRIQGLESDVTNIESVIPNQATDLNQLADKDFVNSSIATSTATFRGTYNSLAGLEAVTADDNDYGFVVSTDQAGNTVYSRYKYANGSWVFEYNLNNSSFTSDQWAAINSGATPEIIASIGQVTGKNIGDIFFTMRTGTIGGAVECDGATYDLTDFSGAQNVGVLLASGELPYVSLAQYASQLTANGSVGVFGWDGQGTTAFRVPSLNDIFIETGTAAQIGDYIAPGLPNITGYIGLWADEIISPQPSGAFALNRSKSARVYDGADQRTSTNGFDFDASRSSSVYGNSTAVQPNTVRYRAMVQLAVSATDEALETCTNVLADVAGLKSHEVIEFQAPTADNNYTWYRKYANGWVEQGGIVVAPASATANVSVTLPVTMRDGNYSITTNVTQGSAYSSNQDEATMNSCIIRAGATNRRATTGFYFSYMTSDFDVMWEVKGMMAESELPSYNSGSSAGVGGTGPEDE